MVIGLAAGAYYLAQLALCQGYTLVIKSHEILDFNDVF